MNVDLIYFRDKPIKNSNQNINLFRKLERVIKAQKEIVFT